MSNATRATAILQQAGIAFTVHSYDYDPAATHIGLHAAAALGSDPAHVLKTLIATVDGRPVCAIIPANREGSMKRLANAFGAKSAQMMRPAEAERLSGYVIGGISPFGLRRRIPTVVEAQAMAHELVYINAGRRGLQIRLSPVDAARVLDAAAAALVI